MALLAIQWIVLFVESGMTIFGEGKPLGPIERCRVSPELMIVQCDDRAISQRASARRPVDPQVQPVYPDKQKSSEGAPGGESPPADSSKGDTAQTQGANRICRQAAGNCERVIGGAGFAVDGSA
jgi:hypothetical protein